MAGSVNKVIILGTLGKDPEYREFKNGGGVTNLSVATSEVWKDKTGERKERTEWHRVSILNDVLGEIVDKYASKGDRIYVEGSLQTRKWTDDKGTERFSTEIVVKGFQGTVQVLGKRQKTEQDGDQNDRPRQSRQAETERQTTAAELDDEIPF
jgi:single-strand DNA-binding protein